MLQQIDRVRPPSRIAADGECDAPMPLQFELLTAVANVSFDGLQPQCIDEASRDVRRLLLSTAVQRPVFMLARANGKRLSDAPPKQAERTDAAGVGKTSLD